MSFTELERQLISMNHSITIDALFTDRYLRLLEDKLAVLTVCSMGHHRSFEVAKGLTAKHIPAICLEGGLSELQYRPDLQESIQVLLHLISLCPIVAVILSLGEQDRYEGLLSQLPKTKRYVTIDEGLHKLPQYLRSSESR